MKKLKHYFPALLVLALATQAFAQDHSPKVKPDDPPPPIVRLPVETPVNVQKYDPNKVRTRAVAWNLAMLKVPEAHALNPAARGKGVRGAILDTGGQKDHPAYKNAIVGTYNAFDKSTDVTDKNGHGTWCVYAVHSIIPDAELIIIKVMNDKGEGPTDVIAHGIDAAVNLFKCDFVSLSLGSPAADPHMRPAIQRATDAGCVVIAAAGNRDPQNTSENYPARYPESVSVAACDKNARLASFSLPGPNVFTCDPGVLVPGAWIDSQEADMSGTSMATPQEAGKCGSWIASNKVPKDKDRAAAFRRAVMAASTIKVRDDRYGYGLYTLDKITGTEVVPPPKPKRPFTVVIGLDDLAPAKKAELASAGIEKFRLEVGHGDRSSDPPAQSIPVQSIPSPLLLAPQLPPQPVPGYWQPPATPWYPPIPSPLPQYMPAPARSCPPQGCRQPLWQPGQVIQTWVIR